MLGPEMFESHPFMNMQIYLHKEASIFQDRNETEAQRKKLENGRRIWGSTILKEVFSSEELSSREVIFIHKYSCVFFYLRLSLIILEFSHLICLDLKTLVSLAKNRKSAENPTNLMPAKLTRII